MSGSFLKVRLTRFQPAKVFSRDVFLNLALNERYIRIVAAGDDISPTLLAKLVAKNVEFLHVPTSDAEQLDPETFPLYLETTPTAAPSAPKEAAVEAVPETTVTKISTDTPAPQPETKTSVDEPEPQLETKISADKPEPQLETRISADQDAPDDGLITIKGAQEAKAAAEEIVFTSQEKLDDEGTALYGRLKAALIGEKIAAEAAVLHKTVNESQLKERKKHRREYVAMAEANERAATNKVNTIVERKYPVDEELQNFSGLSSGKSTPDLISTASDRMLAALKAAEPGRTLLAEIDKLITESERFREAPVLRNIEKKLAAAPQSEAEKQELVKDVKKTFMMNKISEEILKFSADVKEKEPEQRFGAELASLERALETISAGESLPEEVERRFSADKEAEEFVTVFSSTNDAEKMGEQLKTIAAKRDQAMEALSQQRQENGLLRARSHRDLPATVSRLATYLAYSLGYSNVEMLSDLALAAILHFAKSEEGVKISESAMPAFVGKVLNEKSENDFVAADSREILQILQAYIENPECDREQKDFVKRIFDQTVDTLLEKDAQIDGINLAKWIKFVEKGPDLQGHSVCVKASAAAIKQSKSIII